jgi:peptidoglycan hydrolase-like protein with peptidoglycan-binding domain
MVIAKQVDAQLETQKEDSAIAFVKDGVGRSLKARAAVKPLDTPDQPVRESASTGKSVSDTVTEVQIVLQQLGLYKGKIDGLAGRGTTAAIRKFQQMNALPITGLLDDETQAKIIAAKKP